MGFLSMYIYILLFINAYYKLYVMFVLLFRQWSAFFTITFPGIVLSSYEFW